MLTKADLVEDYEEYIASIEVVVLVVELHPVNNFLIFCQKIKETEGGQFKMFQIMEEKTNENNRILYTRE